MSLNEALDRAIKVYDKERLHPAAVDIIANHIGYKSANNGSALSAIASMRYYGLLDRPKEGFLAVSKDVESFRYAPEEEQRRALLIKFLKQPPLYAELLEKYASGLPSDANLKYELIQRGFIPSAAESTLASFKQSVDFSGYYDSPANVGDVESIEEIPSSSVSKPEEVLSTSVVVPSARLAPVSVMHSIEQDDFDRIPVRLSGGRRAWLLIPTPFFAADKSRLKAQIDLLLAEDEENAS
ncbi:hypothetical protein D3871_16810 [Noviherbaspirillum saxi]|uniref:Uncharacterized protein n=2 Tax=Noviherbaspirillum saxi TaxID=2320863 RepID=A0A3A3FHY8_9BURK|nr:hypothetical protein D3871_16810 [Noviherbaspirillum saxi]